MRTCHLNLVAGTVFIAALTTGCTNTAQRHHPENRFAGSSLQSAFTSDNRNSLLWSASYIASNGGPRVPESLTEAREALQKHGKLLSAWVEQQDPETIGKLVDGYLDYVCIQSPYYLE
jgi:hypothetical protein